MCLSRSNIEYMFPVILLWVVYIIIILFIFLMVVLFIYLFIFNGCELGEDASKARG